MKKKIFTTYTILLLMGIILTGLLSLSFMRINYLNNIEEMLISNGRLINNVIEDELDDQSFNNISFSEIAHKYSPIINARITFINRFGTVIGDSEIKDSRVDDIENHANRPEVIKAISGEIGKSKRYSKTIETDYFYVAVPMIKENSIYGVTRLAYPLTEFKKINIGLIKNVIIAIIIGVAVAILLGYRYVNHVTDPIKEITRTAQKIANGDLNNRVYVDTGDEIKILADTFNVMAEKLKINISELQDKNTKLKSILTSMKEGLIAVDNHKEILLINPAAKSLFSLKSDSAVGEDIMNLVEDKELKDTLEIILEDNTLKEIEVSLQDLDYKILKIFTSPIKLNENPNRIIGKLILILDVTEMRKLEKMRTEFVANVSHELKTPLTSITGFIETLKNGAIDNINVRDRFLNIIEIETGRLTRLIDDLLTLSDIESNKLAFGQKEDVSVKEVITEIDHMMDRLVKQKDIQYISEIEERLSNFYGNRDWFKQLVLNLVDNAIKYTPVGGKVKIKCFQENSSIFISVKDTGIGIPKKDIPRLFERFYRVDKARSRKVGGTGLGLAIVKHIVLSLDGDIIVTSEEGKGSEFLVRIPVIDV